MLDSIRHPIFHFQYCSNLKKYLIAVSNVLSSFFGVRSAIKERCDICTDAQPNWNIITKAA